MQLDLLENEVIAPLQSLKEIIETSRWMAENIQGEWNCRSVEIDGKIVDTVVFEMADDAVLFKLRWA